MLKTRMPFIFKKDPIKDSVEAPDINWELKRILVRGLIEFPLIGLNDFA